MLCPKCNTEHECSHCSHSYLDHTQQICFVCGHSTRAHRPFTKGCRVVMKYQYDWDTRVYIHELCACERCYDFGCVNG